VIVVVLLILMELFKLSFDNMSILLYFLKIEIRIMEIQLTFHLEARNLISNVVIKTKVITMFNLRYLQKIQIVLFSYDDDSCSRYASVGDVILDYNVFASGE
jgi:hypothetical protein